MFNKCSYYVFRQNDEFTVQHQGELVITGRATLNINKYQLQDQLEEMRKLHSKHEKETQALQKRIGAKHTKTQKKSSKANSRKIQTKLALVDPTAQKFFY